MNAQILQVTMVAVISLFAALPSLNAQDAKVDDLKNQTTEQLKKGIEQKLSLIHI